eukprot:677354-Pleurochrysis_carterae.AAC.2
MGIVAGGRLVARSERGRCGCARGMPRATGTLSPSDTAPPTRIGGIKGRASASSSKRCERRPLSTHDACDTGPRTKCRINPVRVERRRTSQTLSQHLLSNCYVALESSSTSA